MFEMTAECSLHIGFRVNTLDLGRIVEVFVGAETIVDDGRFSELFLGNTVNGLYPGFVLQYCSTRDKPFFLGGLVFTFALQNTAIVFDHEVNGDEWNILYDCTPLGQRDRFSSAGIVSPSSTRQFVRGLYECISRLPADYFDLFGFKCVALVVVSTILDELDQAVGCTDSVQNRFGNFEIRIFRIIPNVTDLSNISLLENHVECATVILDVDSLVDV